MEEQSEIVLIEPPQFITFSGQINSGKVTTYIYITNKTDKRVFFKVKTTKPERYCVSPAYGSLNPGEKLEVYMKLRQKHLSSHHVKDDKFLIQSMYEEVVPDSGDVLRAFQLAKRSDIFKHRLLVTAEGVLQTPIDNKDNDSASYRSAKIFEGNQKGESEDHARDLMYDLEDFQEVEEEIPVKNGILELTPVQIAAVLDSKDDNDPTNKKHANSHTKEKGGANVASGGIFSDPNSNLLPDEITSTNFRLSNKENNKKMNQVAVRQSIFTSAQFYKFLRNMAWILSGFLLGLVLGFFLCGGHFPFNRKSVGCF